MRETLGAVKAQGDDAIHLNGVVDQVEERRVVELTAWDGHPEVAATVYLDDADLALLAQMIERGRQWLADDVSYDGTNDDEHVADLGQRVREVAAQQTADYRCVAPPGDPIGPNGKPYRFR